MKKYLLTTLVVLAMLAMFAGPAAAAGNVTLVSVAYVPGKGPVFTFEVSGDYSKADLIGALQVNGGGNFKLHCQQIDKDTVTCTVSKKAAGKDVTVTWGGQTFWTKVPGAKTKTQYCYSVWDYNLDGIWTDYGPYCQDAPASYDDPDPILFYNVDWDSEIEYWFWYEEPFCGSGIVGDAYYWVYDCPI
jgi:hypothetical protein